VFPTKLLVALFSSKKKRSLTNIIIFINRKKILISDHSIRAFFYDEKNLMYKIDGILRKIKVFGFPLIAKAILTYILTYFKIFYRISLEAREFISGLIDIDFVSG
jgi:hypothetical protein